MGRFRSTARQRARPSGGAPRGGLRNPGQLHKTSDCDVRTPNRVLFPTDPYNRTGSDGGGPGLVVSELQPLLHFARLSAGCGAPEKDVAVNAMHHRGTWIC